MKTLKEFQNDVETFFKKYESDYIKNKDFHSLYYGYKVFFSPVKQNAKIWIIGINPGKGYWDENEDYIRDVNPRKENEFVTGHFNVANSFYKLFNEHVGDINILSNESVVTNLHFLSTEDEKSLNKIIKNEDYEKYWCKVKEWNDFLLNYINPQLILCFGKASFVDYFNYHSPKELTEYNVKNKIFTESPHWCYKYKNAPIILIKRTPSGIQAGKELGAMINYILK